MAIALRASGSVTYDVASSSQIVTIPAGVQTGDLMIVAWSNTSVGATLTPPSGWTSIALAASGSGMKLQTCYRVAQAGDTTWTFTATGGNATTGIALLTFTGQDPTTPIDVAGVGVGVASGSATAGAITIVTANAWELITYAGNPGGAASATSFTDLSNTAATVEADVLYNTTPKSTGSTGTVVVSGFAGPKAILPFAIRPAPPPATMSPYATLKPFARPRLADRQVATIYG
jgi:hypothetical protein